MESFVGHGITSDEIARRAADRNVLRYFLGTTRSEPDRKSVV